MEFGFERALTCAVVFSHAEKDTSRVVHGDDFTFEGGGPELLSIIENMKSWFEIKMRALLGSEDGDDKHVVTHGRHVRWTADGIGSTLVLMASPAIWQ